MQPLRVAAVTASGQAFELTMNGGEVLLKNPQQLNFCQLNFEVLPSPVVRVSCLCLWWFVASRPQKCWLSLGVSGPKSPSLGQGVLSTPRPQAKIEHGSFSVNSVLRALSSAN